LWANVNYATVGTKGALLCSDAWTDRRGVTLLAEREKSEEERERERGREGLATVTVGCLYAFCLLLLSIGHIARLACYVTGLATTVLQSVAATVATTVFAL